jgi:hypothetical protein
MEDLQELRAALIQIQKAEERHLEGIKRIVAWIDKQIGAPAKTVADSPTATVASAAHYGNHSSV